MKLFYKILTVIAGLLIGPAVAAAAVFIVPQGGTAWANIKANTVLLGNGTGPLATTTAGTNGQVLALVGGVPTWVATTTLSTITGTLPVANGGTGVSSLTGNQFLYTNAAGNAVLTAASSSLSLPNTALQNSTISGISLGGTLGALTATDASLTFSGSYTGATARTVGLNVGNANIWTALQRFSNASTSLLSVFQKAYFGGTATSTFDSAGNLVVAGTLTVQSTATSTIPNLSGILFADGFAGADIGARINTAYAFAPSSRTTIMVTQSATFSTPIIFGTDQKRVILQCSQGVTLTYTGTATSTKLNYGYSPSLDFGQGIRDCTFVGPSKSGTTVGIEMGGPNGAQGTLLTGIKVTGFGTGVVASANTWGETILASLLQDNGRNLEIYPANNSGENIAITDSIIADSSHVTVADIEKCVYLRTNATASIGFTNTAFDDCGFTQEEGNVGTTFTGGHFEDPDPVNYKNYRFITSNATAGWTLIGTQFYSNATTSPNLPFSFIFNLGKAALYHPLFNLEHSIAPTAMVYNQGASAKLDIYSYHANGTAFTNIATSSLGLFIDSDTGVINTNYPISSQGNPIFNLSDPTQYPLLVVNPNSINASSTGICFAVSNTINGACGGGIGFQRQGSGSFGDTFLFSSDSGAVARERLRINYFGNVGIAQTGLNALAASLEVMGTTTNATGNVFTLWDSTAAKLFNVNDAGTVTLPKLATAAGAFLAVNGNGDIIATTTPSGGGAVSSVSNADGSLTISPTTGIVVASLNPANANVWTALQRFSMASTSQLSVFQSGYFGGTATSTFASDGSLTLVNPLTYGGVTLANAVTGTGNMVLSAAPTFSGSVTIPTARGGTNVGSTIAILGTTNNNPTTAGVSIQVSNGTNTGQKNFLSMAGFGFGTTTPYGPVEVSSSTAPQLTLDDGALSMWNFRAMADGSFAVATRTNALGYATSSVNAMFFDKNGKVSFPNQLLSPYNSTTAAHFLCGDGTDTSDLCLGMAGGRGMFGYTTADGAGNEAALLNAGSGKGIDFYVNGTNGTIKTGTQAVSILSDGRVGVATTSPWATLSVTASSGNNPLFAVATSSGQGLPNFMIDNKGHVIYSGGRPICDANCTFVAGNDSRFRVKTATSVTSTTVTFSQSWGTPSPICHAEEGDAGTVAVAASSTPTTVVLTAGTGLTAKDIEVFCDGIQ